MSLMLQLLEVAMERPLFIIYAMVILLKAVTVIQLLSKGITHIQVKKMNSMIMLLKTKINQHQFMTLMPNSRNCSNSSQYNPIIMEFYLEILLTT